MGIVGKLFSFEGRLRRRDWWLWHLVIIAVSFLVWSAAARLNDATTADFVRAHRTSVLGVGLYLALLWPQLALDVKRLHDRNRSGWWLVLFYPPMRFQTYVTAADPGALDRLGIALPLAIFLLVVFVAIIVELGLRDAAPGAERFGPPPKAGKAEDPSIVFE